MKLTEKQKNCRCCHEKGGNHYVKPIKRTRKRQIAKAKHMMTWHDHTSYEWSQWWHKQTRKPKRWSK